MESPSEDDEVAEARKAAAYRYLLPQAPASLVAKVQSGNPGSADLGSADRAEVAAPKVDPRRLALTGPDWPALSAEAARDRAVGCLLGLAVGDAVGAAVEFKPRGSFPPLNDMIGGGPFDLAMGEWTDDTTMAICLAESILATRTVDLDDFMTRLQRWVEHGENSVTGTCFDIGITTRGAIERFAATGSAASGSQEPDTAGNGSLSRLAPLAIFARRDPEQAGLMAARQSRATHGAAECVAACELFTSQLIDALNGADKNAATRPRIMSLPPRLLFINAGEWRQKNRDQINSSGYVVHTLEAALWSIWQTDNFRDAVLTAANLGDDADSVAAVAGQLAGAVYGASAIPEEWLEKLAWRARLEELAQDLFEARPVDEDEEDE